MNVTHYRITPSYCDCPIPEPKMHKPGRCVKCSLLLDPETTSNDHTLAQFLDRFERTFPAFPHLPEWWQDLRLHVESRERAGRKTFRQTFHSRNNLAECREEVCDGLLYVWLDTLVARRHGEDEETDVVLEIANHFALAYQGLAQLRHKRHGAP